jgi:uncharacterized protein (DUF983 family)
MFIIFGWGRQTRTEFGSTMLIQCPHCNNTKFWDLIKLRTWFTLFFIPLIPYSSEVLLVCPVCAHGLGLDDSQMAKAIQLNELTRKLLQEEMGQDEYLARASQIEVLQLPGASGESTGNGNVCPQCGSPDVYKAYIEDGGQGDWCPNCKMSLQKMRPRVVAV